MRRPTLTPSIGKEVGSFCPVRVLATNSPLDTPDYDPTKYPNPTFRAAYGSPSLAVNDFGYDPSYDSSTSPTHGCDWEPFWRYHWASTLFDYLSVRSPSDDYFPNYPVQKEWRGDRAHDACFGAADLLQGRPRQLLQPRQQCLGRVGAARHEIYLCTADCNATTVTPNLDATHFAIAFAARP